MLDLDDQIGIGETNAVAGGRSVVVRRRCVDRFLALIENIVHRSERRSADAFIVERPSTESDSVRRSRACRRWRPSSTSRVSPGSKRNRGAGGDVQPHAAWRQRGRTRGQRLTSKKWTMGSDLHRPVAAVADLDPPASRGPAFSSIGSDARRYSPGFIPGRSPRVFLRVLRVLGGGLGSSVIGWAGEW